jgi:hypothetical protein
VQWHPLSPWQNQPITTTPHTHTYLAACDPSGLRTGSLARPSISQQRLEEQRRRLQKVPDAASLFWFGRPLLVLKMFQLVFFANSMSIALLIFVAWQDASHSWIFHSASWVRL